MNDAPAAETDIRLYAPQPDNWLAHVKRTAEKEYCYIKNPGEDHFHLLAKGEVYLEHQGEKYCLNCALRQGGLTRNRQFWQRSSSAET